MKVEKRQETIVREKNVYIANDGTEFEQEWMCKEYEKAEAIKSLSCKVKCCESLDGYMPFDGNEYCEYHSYRWYYVSSQDDVDVINEAFSLDEAYKITENEIGKWICIEEDDGYAWVTTLERCLDYVRTVMEKIRDKMIEEKKSLIENINFLLMSQITKIIKDKNSLKLCNIKSGVGVYGGLYIINEGCSFDKIKEIIVSDEFIDYVKSLKKFKSGGYYTFSSSDLKKFLVYKLYGRQ